MATLTPLSTTAATLAINAGSSSIRWALFTAGSSPARTSWGAVSRIGTAEASLAVSDAQGHKSTTLIGKPDRPGDYRAAMSAIIRVLDTTVARSSITAIGHRIVHGGPLYWEPQRIDQNLLAGLRAILPFAPNHLPAEISLIEDTQRHFPNIPQVACFDTAFHHDLPTVARTLPIPRHYIDKGLRKYGFHGLSYAFLMSELLRLAPAEASGRVILAHLGNGASMAAVHAGQPIDTTMGFTPIGGMVMGTRSGDLDPGVLAYLGREETLSPGAVEDLLSHQSGMLGLSETTADMQRLLAQSKTDPRSAEAIDLFCYSARKWIGALAAAMGGVDTLVFSGGIGEHAAEIRSRICEGPAGRGGFLGITADPERNNNHAPVISPDNAPVTVRVIATDEEVMIARAVNQLLREKKA